MQSAILIDVALIRAPVISLGETGRAGGRPGAGAGGSRLKRIASACRHSGGGYRSTYFLCRSWSTLSSGPLANCFIRKKASVLPMHCCSYIICGGHSKRSMRREPAGLNSVGLHALSYISPAATLDPLKMTGRAVFFCRRRHTKM